jgi:hypothetical protein
MSRRKLTVVEQAIKDAAAELKLPKNSWDVERLATMQVMLKVARHKWSQGQSSSAAGDMLQLMESITTLRREAKLSEPMDIEVNVVRRATGIADVTCKHCGKTDRYDLPDTTRSTPESTPQPEATHGLPIEPQPRPSDDPAPAESMDSNPDSAPADASAPAKVRGNENPTLAKPAAPTPKVTRPGISPSRFHDQQLPSGETPPLKRLQAPLYPIRSVSPMSNGKG